MTRTRATDHPAIFDAAGANVDANSGVTTHLPTITQITMGGGAGTDGRRHADYSG